jgi:pimeloyl-ACP methyl ester carboxylesterase
VASQGQSPAPAVSAATTRPRTSRRIIIWLIVLVILILGGWGLRRVADAHLRAMSVLIRLSDPGAQGFLAGFAHHPFIEQDGVAETPQGSLKFRLYIPIDVPHPGAVLLLHGIHRSGIEEPRVNFARTMASAGIEVMTPELADLADYRVTPRTVDAIGDATIVLSAKLGLPRVGILGLSFAGGLALLTATKPEYADRIGFVVAVGAHDDMTRVARFFADNMVEEPDGSTVAFKAHEYGVLVLAYSHLEDFFSPRDTPAAREALHKWLWEQPNDAMEIVKTMSPAGQREFDLMVHHRDQLQPTLLKEIKNHGDEMQAVSPHSQVSQLHIPVYLLHGTTDSVIPSSETLWLAKDVPAPALKTVLISPAMNMIHVDGQHPVTLSQKWVLVDFMAQILKASQKLGRAHS